MLLCILSNAIVSLAHLCNRGMLVSSAGSSNVEIAPPEGDGGIVSQGNNAVVDGRNGWRHVHLS
jgi:hypothetical protein